VNHDLGTGDVDVLLAVVLGQRDGQLHPTSYNDTITTLDLSSDEAVRSGIDESFLNRLADDGLANR
jgi:hypothetical protein